MPEKHSCHDQFISIYNDPLGQQVIDARAWARAPHTCSPTRWCPLKNMRCSCLNADVENCAWIFRSAFSSLFNSFVQLNKWPQRSTAHQVVSHPCTRALTWSNTQFVKLIWNDGKMRDSNLFCYLMVCDRGADVRRTALNRTFNWFPSHQVQCTHLSESIDCNAFRLPLQSIAAMVFIFVEFTNQNELFADLFVVDKWNANYKINLQSSGPGSHQI